MSVKPATFLLVHGAWHGSWCYNRVARLLRARGHTVYSPTLSGLAERSHQFSGDINLSAHVTDILNVIKWEELSDIVLCGHSYGGMVITGVAEAASERISSIVYLDAFLPGDNQSLMDLVPAASLKGRSDAAGQLGGIGLPPATAKFFGVNDKDEAMVDRLCTLQPYATFLEKNKSTSGLTRIRKKHYILAAGYQNGGLFNWAYEKVRDDPAWTSDIMPCGHDVMIDMPEQLAASLEKAAG